MFYVRIHPKKDVLRYPMQTTDSGNTRLSKPFIRMKLMSYDANGKNNATRDTRICFNIRFSFCAATLRRYNSFQIKINDNEKRTWIMNSGLTLKDWLRNDLHHRKMRSHRSCYYRHRNHSQSRKLDKSQRRVDILDKSHRKGIKAAHATGASCWSKDIGKVT